MKSTFFGRLAPVRIAGAAAAAPDTRKLRRVIEGMISIIYVLT